MSQKREVVEQQFFEELKDTFFFQLHRVQKAFFKQSNRLVDGLGMNLQMEQFPILMTVYALKSVSQREIADMTMRDKSSVQRSVTALQRKGLLTVEQDAADKRKNIVTLTAEGSALAKKIKQLIRKAEENIFVDFSEEERSKAFGSIRDLANKLSPA